MGSATQRHSGPDDQPLHRKGAVTVAQAPFLQTAVTEPLFSGNPTINHMLPTLYGPKKEDF